MTSDVLRQLLLLLLLLLLPSRRFSALGAKTMDVVAVDSIPVCDAPYGTVVKEIELATHGDSRLRCAMECRQHRSCMSIVVNHDSNKCILNKFEKDSWPACGVPNSMYAYVPPLSTMRENCSADNECYDLQSKCINTECRCVPGLSFDQYTTACVPTCPGEYGDTFQEDNNHYISGFSSSTLSSVSEAQCMQGCLDETAYVCVHAEYYKPYNRCYMSSYTLLAAETMNSNAYRSSTSYKLFFRDCI